jgi:exonuclease SbcC
VAAATHLDSCVETLAAIDRELSELDERLEGRPTESDARASLVEIQTARTELDQFREIERAASAEVEVARRELAQVEERERSARRELSATRDELAAAKPPELELADLESDWQALVSWSRDQAGDLEQSIEEHERRLTELREERSELLTSVVRLIEPWGIDPDDPHPGDRLIALVSTADVELKSLERDRKTAAERATALAQVKQAAEVARALALHLQASRFEGWLMEEALVGLVAGANTLLGQLSSGAYSLVMAKRDFMVIDHRNADETRGVKTLSGGETFLVSLALALSLAEQIGGMAAGGGARLESIFLDEGFGTLDADTLDVVASVIQELGASGRTVGIVTHVTELAELVPTRFEVVRGVGGSTVKRVDT